MAVPAALSHIVESWASYYEAHRFVSVGIRYLHIAGLIIGGGTALATDRHVFRAARGSAADHTLALGVLGASHTVVIPALTVVILSGILMTAADTSTFLASRLYWLKMGLVVLLMANGLFLVMAEAAARRADEREEGTGGHGWPSHPASASCCGWSSCSWGRC